MKDIRIIPDTSGDVTFSLMSGDTDSGILLLQRLYVLLLSDISDAYRGSSDEYTLGRFMKGSNYTSDGAVTSVLVLSCASALKALDDEDRARIASFDGECVDGVITCTLTLTDGTTLKGSI